MNEEKKKYRVDVHVTYYGAIEVFAVSEEVAIDQVVDMDNAHGIADSEYEITYEVEEV